MSDYYCYYMNTFKIKGDSIGESVIYIKLVIRESIKIRLKYIGTVFKYMKLHIYIYYMYCFT